MTTAQRTDRSVLCVDDNPHVADALRVTLTRAGACVWIGWIPDASALAERVCADRPTIVILDLDMPGNDPFQALAEISARCPQTKTVIFSGHLRRDLIDRAIEAGAWGYVSKNEGETVHLDAIERILDDEVTLSPAVRAVLEG